MRHLYSPLVLLLVGFSFAAIASAQQPAEKPRVSLTVYSMADPGQYDPQLSLLQQRGAVAEPSTVPGFGVVREVRKLALKAGVNTVKFIDVAALIDPTTVSFKSLTAPQTTVLEQSFEYDLINSSKLLEKYIGRTIIINRKQPPAEGEKVHRPETIESKLLSFTETELVLQTNNKQLPVQIVPRTADIMEIKLFDIETGLITRPTLVWSIETDRPGDHDALVSYQTDGITWRADYRLEIGREEKTADVSAWVTLVNESGAAYPDAKLKLVAGDVQRMERRRELGGGIGGADSPQKSIGFTEKAFFEYHLYTLGRAASIPNNSIKQIELFPGRSNVPVEKIYVYNPLAERRFAGAEPATEPLSGASFSKKVHVYLKLQNSQKNGLGLPLPAGRLRVYKRDQDGGDDPAGSLELVGEDKIDHTPADEQILARLGSAFDLVGQRKVTSFQVDETARTMSESIELRLRNHKKEPVTILAVEPLYRWHNWEITASSDKFEKKDASTISFSAPLNPDQEKTITYTVKYSW